MPLHYYSDLAVQTTLTGSISPSATTISVASTTGFPASFPYYLALDYGNATLEVVEVTGAASLNLTVNRGVSGTTAVSHSTGAPTVHVAPAQFYNDTSMHTTSNSGVHGVTGSVVGTSDTQTLTNKTISGSSNTITNLNAANITSGQVPIANGGTNAATASAARTNLGVAIGSNVEAWNAGLDQFAALAGAAGLGFTAITGTNTVASRVLAVGGASSPAITWTNGAGTAGNPTLNLGFKSPVPTVTTGGFGSGSTGGTGTTFSYAAPSPMPAYLLIYGTNGGPGGGGSAGGGAGAGSVGGGGVGAAAAWKMVAKAGLTFPLQVIAAGGGGGGGPGTFNGGNGGQSTVKDNNGSGATLWTPGAPNANGVGRGDASRSTAALANNSGFDITTSSAVADYVVYGSPGSAGVMLSGTIGQSGTGGASVFGGGGFGQGGLGNTNGMAAPGYGGGGGGSVSTTTNETGGGGGGAIVVIVPVY